MQVGDTVGYSADFCRSILADGWTASRRGILERAGEHYSRVQWTDAAEPQTVLTQNIARVGSFRFAHNS